MKILLFIHSMAAGGAERVTANLANEWIAKGYQVTVLTQDSSKVDFYPLAAGVVRIGLDSARSSPSLFHAVRNNLFRLMAIRRVIRSESPDVIIGMMTISNVLAILATLGLHIPVVACERTYPPLLPVGSFWDLLRRWTYPLAARVSMLTSEGGEWLKREIPCSDGVVIPNPVLYPLPVTTPVIVPDTVIQYERRMLLAVGRMSEEKGFLELISAFNMLVGGNPLWDLVILGDGPLRPVLLQQIHKLDLSGRVFMPGRVGNVGIWYERADLYVMSSRVEGFPNTLCEAMAHGCAAVSFDCDTGPRDLIRHEVDGLLVPKGNVTELANSLSQLMLDDTRRGQMSIRATEVRTRYSMSQVLEMWDRLLTDVFKKLER